MSVDAEPAYETSEPDPFAGAELHEDVTRRYDQAFHVGELVNPSPEVLRAMARLGSRFRPSFIGYYEAQDQGSETQSTRNPSLPPETHL